jgi:DNA polymerase-3 subunit alpha
VAEREQNGPYRGLYDFCRRLPPEKVPKAAVKLLVEAGAFDEFGERNALLAACEQAAAAGHKHQQDQAVGRISLFGQATPTREVSALAEPPLPSVPPLADEEILAMEKRVLGLYVSAHPLEKNAARVQQCTTARIEEVGEFPTRASVVVAGLVEEARRHLTRNGEPMLYVTLQGVADSLEVTVFPSTCEACGEVFRPGALVVVSGRVERRGANGDNGENATAKLLCDRAWPLSAAPRVPKKKKEEAVQLRKRYAEERAKPPPPPPPQVVIELDALTLVPEDLQDLRALVEEFPGHQQVVLRFLQDGNCRRVALGHRYRVDMSGAFPVRARQLPVVLSIYEEKAAREAAGREPLVAPEEPPEDSEEYGADE